MDSVKSITEDNYGTITTVMESGKYYCAYSGGDKVYYYNNRLHRDEGPALEYASGYRAWFIHGVEIKCSSNEEFLRIINLKSFW